MKLTPSLLQSCPVAKLQRHLSRLDRSDMAAESLVADALALEQDAGKPRDTVINALRHWLDQSSKALAKANGDQDLNSLAKGINAGLDGIESHHETFRRASLPVALEIGSLCLSAHGKFAVKSHAQRGARKSSSRREELSFGSWLKETSPRLKEATAYKYMTALKGLGLDAGATLADIEAALARLENPTLAMLASASRDQLAPPEPLPLPPEQQVFPFMREFRLAGEQVIAMRDAMDPEAYKAAIARSYDILHRLTGQHWGPTDHAPDTIDLALLEATGV